MKACESLRVASTTREQKRGQGTPFHMPSHPHNMWEQRYCILIVAEQKRGSRGLPTTHSATLRACKSQLVACTTADQREVTLGGCFLVTQSPIQHVQLLNKGWRLKTPSHSAQPHLEHAILLQNSQPVACTSAEQRRGQKGA